jgi:hypothetical protein
MPRRKANTQRLDSLQSASSGVDVLLSNLLPASTEGEEVNEHEEAVPYNVYVCDDHDSDEEESSRKQPRKAPNKNKKQRLGAAVTIVSSSNNNNNQGDDDRVKLGRLNMHLGGQDGDGRETAVDADAEIDVAALSLKLSVRILLLVLPFFLVCDVAVSLLSIY